MSVIIDLVGLVVSASMLASMWLFVIHDRRVKRKIRRIVLNNKQLHLRRARNLAVLDIRRRAQRGGK